MVTVAIKPKDGVKDGVASPFFNGNLKSGDSRLALIFKWDKRKAKSNLSKHKVTFEEASTIFGDSLTITIDDPLHSSDDEQRFITIGSSYRGKILVVVHCDREDNIRIISARTATRKEKKIYEEGK